MVSLVTLPPSLIGLISWYLGKKGVINLINFVTLCIDGAATPTSNPVTATGADGDGDDGVCQPGEARARTHPLPVFRTDVSSVHWLLTQRSPEGVRHRLQGGGRASRPASASAICAPLPPSLSLHPSLSGAQHLREAETRRS